MYGLKKNLVGYFYTKKNIGLPKCFPRYQICRTSRHFGNHLRNSPGHGGSRGICQRADNDRCLRSVSEGFRRAKKIKADVSKSVIATSNSDSSGAKCKRAHNGNSGGSGTIRRRVEKKGKSNVLNFSYKTAAVRTE